MPPSRVTDDEARELFSAFHDRELTPERHEAVENALKANPHLRSEYEAFSRMLTGLQNLAERAEKTAPSRPGVAHEPASPDLLAGVQQRLHKRSRGKFYGDRWSHVAGVFPLELIALGVLVVLAVAWFAMTGVDIRPAPTATTPPTVTTQPAR